MSPAPLVALYVPGDRPERFARALAAGADQVIVDLEDAVAPGHKDTARLAVAELLDGRQAPRPPVHVRPNAVGSPWWAEDLAMLRGARHLAGVRLPKVESADQVRAVASALGRDDVGLVCLLESARGIERAAEIATAHPAVTGLAMGEADLRAELGITAPAGLDWLRTRVVVAARAAGLPAPMMSAYPRLDDDAGLAASCRAGAALGFLGRTAVHPRQVQVIRTAFAPDAAELAEATAVMAALARGQGVAVLADGRMVDAAMAAEAERVLARRAEPDGG